SLDGIRRRTTKHRRQISASLDQAIRLLSELVLRDTHVLKPGTNHRRHLTVLVSRQPQIVSGIISPLFDLARARLKHRIHRAETLLGLRRDTDQLFTDQTGDTNNSGGRGDQTVLPLREIAAGLLKLAIQPIGLVADSPQSSLGVAGIPGNGQRNRWPSHYINPLSLANCSIRLARMS